MQRQTQGSAGHDLIPIMMERKHDHTLISTGVVANIPEGHFGLLVMRSSTSIGLGMGLLNGVGIIDSDYKDEIKLILPVLTNQSADKIISMIGRQDRIAQLIIIPYVALTESKGKRKGGIGSTGK